MIDDEEYVTFSIGYVHEHCSWNWDDLCTDVGLNPWCLNEGLASSDDRLDIGISTAKKYGLIK